MAKFVARFYCLVEAVVEAESNEQVLELCDLNVCDVNKLPHTITELDDVVEVEDVGVKRKRKSPSNWHRLWNKSKQQKNSGWLMIQKGLCCYYKQQAER